MIFRAQNNKAQAKSISGMSFIYKNLKFIAEN
jgi:hypothetical protein